MKPNEIAGLHKVMQAHMMGQWMENLIIDGTMEPGEAYAFLDPYRNVQPWRKLWPAQTIGEIDWLDCKGLDFPIKVEDGPYSYTIHRMPKQTEKESHHHE